MSTTHHVNRPNQEPTPSRPQPAHNPVDWYRWGGEALSRARRENRPILLSVGYPACHWCHVMAHESFEDEATAKLMNELFVNIKVDREERPDLDRIYQAAHQLLTGRGGGWPLTMFLTPEQVPFFGGTYFPPEPRHGLPAFRDALRRVAAFYHEHGDQLAEQNQSLLHALTRTAATDDAPGRLDARPLLQAREQLTAAYDARYHGFGAAPKFPHPTNLEFLLQRDDAQARRMALDTLRAMAHGGLQDQLGGGFFRYSVDARWAIPHFEKMLYDNGPLLALFTDAWQVSGDDYFAQVAAAIGDWVLREMEQPQGGYYATQDADSDGGEGRFYLWDAQTLRGLLSDDEFQVTAAHYGLDRPANFEGLWHLQTATPLADVATALGIDATRALALLTTAQERMRKTRGGRPAPGRDDKVIAAWNGLMIKGMASAGRRLGRPDFVASAQRAVDFIREHMFRTGRLCATWKDGQARHAGYLDDYAFLLDGVLELLQAQWRDADMHFAVTLAETLLEAFEDESHGGFFFTAADHERLIHRPKPLADEAIPSGNGIAARALSRLGHLVGNLDYLDAAEKTVRNAWPAFAESPYAHATLVLALEDLLTPRSILVLRGTAAATAAWQRHLETNYRPWLYSVAIPSQALELPGLLVQRPAGTAPVTAYLCSGEQCHAPFDERDALEQTLRQIIVAAA